LSLFFLGLFGGCCFEVAGLGCFEFRSSVSATKRWPNQMSEPSSAFCVHSNAACVLASRKLLKIRSSPNQQEHQSDRRGVVEKRKKARELGVVESGTTKSGSTPGIRLWEK
jgi:hypothetical protein